MGNATFTDDIHVTTESVPESSGQFVSHWMLVDGDGTRLDFGPASGAPTATAGIFSRLSATGSGFTLNNAGPPEAIARAGNFTYTFGAGGQLTQIRDATGNVQTLTYDGSNHPIRVLDGSTQKDIRFVYTGGLISSVVENGGLATTNLTYQNGRLAGMSVTSPLKAVAYSYAFTYSADGLLQSIVRDGDPATAQNFSYTLAPAAEPGQMVPLANETDAEHHTQLTWGLNPGSGAAERVSSVNSSGGVTFFDFDATGALVREILPAHAGATQPTVYSFQNDANFLVRAVSDGATTTRIDYAPNGLPTAVINGAGDRREFTYKGVDVTRVFDPIGTLLQVEYNDAAQPHVPTRILDGDGAAWTLSHNSHGQITKVAPPAGSPAGASTVDYDENPRSPSLGYPLVFKNGKGEPRTIDSYDLLGDITGSSTYPVSGKAKPRLTEQFSYDAAQRETGDRHPDGSVFQRLYAGQNLGTTVDEAGSRTTFGYCAPCGALEKISGPLGWGLAWELNGDHDVSQFTDARGKRTTYRYGLARELVETDYPDGTTETYRYDNAGRVRQVINGRGHVQAFSYDPAGRVSRVDFPTSGEPPITYAYNVDGTVQTVGDAVGVHTFAYKPSRLVESISHDFSASGLPAVQRVDYTYKPDHSRASVAWSSGGQVVASWNYGLDAAGRLVGVSNSFGETTTWSRDGVGKITGQTNANGTSLAMDYNDARGWPVSMMYRRGKALFAGYALQYDGGRNTVGNLTGVTEADGTRVSYTYDALYRLTGDKRTGRTGVARTYGYDLAGNITQFNGASFGTYDDANKIASLSGGSAAYDGDGNLTRIPGQGVPATTLGWDDRSKLLQQSAGGATVGYGSDATGKRAWSQSGAGARTFYIFDGDLLIGEVQAGGPTAAYTWGAAGLVSERLAGGGRSLWYHFGPQGETRQLTDVSGKVVDNYLYSPYGVTVAMSGTDANPFRYGGRFGYYSDVQGQSGLVLCGARWYTPALGRWVSRDPIGLAGGADLYQYCAGNPLRYADASGAWPDGILGYDSHDYANGVVNPYPEGSPALEAMKSQVPIMTWNGVASNVNSVLDPIQKSIEDAGGIRAAIGVFKLKGAVKGIGEGLVDRMCGVTDTQSAFADIALGMAGQGRPVKLSDLLPVPDFAWELSPGLKDAGELTRIPSFDLPFSTVQWGNPRQ